MRIEMEPARTHDHRASEQHPSAAAGDADRGWSDDELARLRTEWDAEPGHR